MHETWVRVDKAEWPAWTVPQILGCLRRATHVLVQYVGDAGASHWALYYDGNLFVATCYDDITCDADLGKWADARLSQLLGSSGSVQWHSRKQSSACPTVTGPGQVPPATNPGESRVYQLKPRKEKDFSLPSRSKKKFGLQREDESDD